MLLNNIVDLWDKFSAGMQTVYDLLNSKLVSLLAYNGVSIADVVLSFIAHELGIGDWTVLDLMFNVGIPIIVVFSLLKWFIDLLP